MTAPGWISQAVFYQLAPAQFHDANGDRIGDLAGITAKLDYLAELGVTAVLVHACYASPFRNGGWDVSDHRALAPRYGSVDDLRRLVRAARERDIRICFDLIPTHTSSDHQWFVASSATRSMADADVALAERYIWHPDPAVVSDDGLQFAPRLGARRAAHAFVSTVHQPRLNYGFAQPRAAWQQPVDAPGPAATWQALRETIAHWLDAGIAGFRVLAPHRMVAADPYFVATRTCWQDVNGWLHERFPDAVLMSTWGVPELAADAGFAIDLLDDGELDTRRQLFGDARTGAAGCLEQRRGADFAPFWRSFAFQQARLPAGRFAGLATGGPELPRLAAGRSEAELKAMLTFVLTWPVVPSIYFGDEIGLQSPTDVGSADGDLAEVTFPWGDDGAATVPALSLATHRARRDSLWHHVERLIYLRTTEADLAPGAGVALLSEPVPDQPIVYRRGTGIVVALNPSAGARHVRLSPLGDVTPVLGDRCQVSHDAQGWQLRLAPGAYGVFNVR
jgi:glycosidase